jgi:sec-independent protein translocase protein TatC
MSESDSFISHLVELRTRLLRSVLAILIVFGCLFPWSREIYSFVAAPLLAVLPAGSHMIATEVITPFLVPLKLSLMAAFVIALPLVLYQIWAFVSPGLYAHEKRWIAPLVFASTVLFFAGMVFAYFVVFPVVFKFVTSVAPDGVAVMTDISKYFDFVMTLFVAFGVTFEVPVLVVVLAATGMVSLEKIKHARPYVIVGAIFTPPDVISQFLLALPLWLLYEIGILVSMVIVRTKHWRRDASHEFNSINPKHID